MFLGIGLGLTQQAIGGGVAGLNAQLASAAGIQPAISADLKSGQAWLRGAPYALTSLPGWSFSRALAAYGETSAGVLQSFASGAPRLVNGRGQLIEGARTNLCLRSQEFDNASWTKTRSSISADAIAAPDGTLTADKLVEDSSAGTHIVTTASTIGSAAQHSYTVLLKAAERTWAYLNIVSEANAFAYFNLATGAVGTVGGAAAASIRALANGWYACTIVVTFTAARTCQVGLATGDTQLSYTGNGTSGIYVWASQLEAAASPSSYIPTTTASVTRPADIPLIDISAYSPAITYPLTMYARFERVVDTGGAEGLLCAFGGAGEFSEIMISSTDVARQVVQNGGVSSVDQTAGSAYALVTPGKMAARVATNDSRIQGLSAGATDASSTNPTSPISLLLGTRSGSGSPLFGYLSELGIIPGAVSDANLPRLAPA